MKLWTIFYAFLSKGGGALLAYLVFAMAARSTSLAEFGRFNLGFTLGQLGAQIILFGQTQYLLKTIPASRATASGEDKAQAFTSSVLMVSLGGGVLFAVFAASAAYWGAAFAFACWLFVMAFALSELESSALRADGRVGWALLPRDIVWRGLLLAIFGGFMMVGLLVSGTVLLYAAAVTLLLVVILQEMFRHGDLVTPRRVVVMAQASGSVWFWLSSIVTTSGPSITIVIASFVVSDADLGLLSAGLRTAQVLNLLLIAANMVGAPIFSRLFSCGEFRALQKYLVSVVALTGSFAVLLAACFTIFGDWILQIFGAEYIAAYPYLLIFSCSFLFSCLCGSAGSLLAMTGRESLLFWIMSLSVVVNIVLCLLFLMLFGVAGAPMSYLCSQVLWNFLAVLACRICLGLDPSLLGWILRPSVNHDR